MYVTYQTVDYNTRVALGNGTASAYATSVSADIIGILTGTITLSSQLSSYADKPSCLIQGAAGDWTVYDADAHPGYPGTCKVLRRLCADGINYQYLFIGFRMPTTDYLAWLTLPIAGWNNVTKAPTTIMDTGTGTAVAAGTVISVTNVAMTNQGDGVSGTNNTRLFQPISNQAVSPLSWKILSTPALLAVWPDSSSGANVFPITLLAEFQTMHPWNSSALGVTPLVYASGTGYLNNQVPQMRNNAGTITAPDYSTLFSVSQLINTVGNTYFYDACSNLTNYTRDANGLKAIPIVPIDVKTYLGSNGYFCYAGRILSLYGTLKTLNVSDTFTVGADTYIVIPTGGYSALLTAYSATGKLCAKIA